MKLLILSDTHFGYDEGGERWSDPFDAVEAAAASHTDADAVLLVGDIFDSRIPTPETLARALVFFERLRQQGTPVVGIHGTHERRTKEFVNPVQLLEKAGLVTYLHCSSHLLTVGGEQVCVYGMGGVPDQYAGAALAAWNPQPRVGTYTILLLHQSLEGFLFAPHLLRLTELPAGFTLYINGHIHDAQHASVHGKPLLITGSAIQTQFSADAEKPRGYWTVETTTPTFTFHIYPSQRQFFSVDGSPADIEARLHTLLASPYPKKPVIRVRLPAGETGILEPFRDKAIFLLKEADVPAGVTLEEHTLSVLEQGQQLLTQRLQQAGLDPPLFEEVFELLAAGRLEEAERKVMGITKEKV